MWIHNHKNWPNFNWDTEKLASNLADIRYRQGLLLGKMKGLGFALKSEANLNTLTNDVIKSSAIEGENLNPIEVRSSIARRLGLDIAGLVPSSRNVDGVVELMLDATQNYAIPLSKERLFGWQSALFPTGRSGLNRITIGKWRTAESGPMQVVSGPIGRENVHYEAPNANRLEKEMKLFIKRFNSTQDNVDPVLRAGIAHFWFITIHPFEDGNGRIARAIADMSLARADGIPERFYSLSTQIESERKGYYQILETQQRGTPDITNWLEWFIECIGRSITGAEKSLSTVLFKSRLWEEINQQPPVNERQRLIVNRMLDDGFEGFMNTSKYAKLAKCSTDTALRDIQTLKERGILIQNPGGGRSTSYRLVKV